MDPETAIELGRDWGIRCFELKTLWEGKRVPLITADQRSHLQRIVRDYGVEIVALSPGLFMGTEAFDDLAAHEVRTKLPGSLEMAAELGAKILVIFGFRKTEGVGESWVVEQLHRVTEAAQGYGVTLVIEPMAGTYADSGQALGRIIRAVGSDLLRVNWDPANVAYAGYRAYPDEYRLIKDLVAHVHLKNYRADRGEWALFDRGDLDLEAQVRELEQDGYAGYLAIETHTRFNKNSGPVIAASQHNHDLLLRWLAGHGR